MGWGLKNLGSISDGQRFFTSPRSQLDLGPNLCRQEVGRNPVQTTGIKRYGRGPGARQCCIYVCLGSIIICRLYKLTLSDEA